MATARRTPREVQAWLASEPSLDQLRDAYPTEWVTVDRELHRVVDTGDRAALDAYVRRLADPPAVKPGTPFTSPGLDPVLAARVRQRMAALAIRSLGVRAATGVEHGSLRFGRINGTIIQRLLFETGLRRKPVSQRRFRLLWPLLTQRRRLMPLVQPQGIYCFYSAQFVTDLARLIGNRSALEIAAGDGTLTRFLSEKGVAIEATDDQSWEAIQFPAEVHRADAREALKTREPQVVLCCWPPAGNVFEANVFTTPSVETYIVIGNRHTPGWGNHEAYAEQTEFARSSDERLARLVLPPELESVVYVFDRSTPERLTANRSSSSV